MAALFGMLNSIPQYMLPHIEENIGGLTDKGSEFVRVAELARVDRHLMPICVQTCLRPAALCQAAVKPYCLWGAAWHKDLAAGQASAGSQKTERRWPWRS